MATTKIEVDDTGWTQVSAASVEFLIENPLSRVTYIRFGSAAPDDTNDVDGHRLTGGETLTRDGINGAVYARADDGTYDMIVTENSA